MTGDVKVVLSTERLRGRDGVISLNNKENSALEFDDDVTYLLHLENCWLSEGRDCNLPQSLAQVFNMPTELIC